MKDLVFQYRKTIKEISEIVQAGDFDVEEIRTLTADAFYLSVEISAASLGIESVDESESTTITLVYPDWSSRQITLHPIEVISNTNEAEEAIKRIMEK